MNDEELFDMLHNTFIKNDTDLNTDHIHTFHHIEDSEYMACDCGYSISKPLLVSKNWVGMKQNKKIIYSRRKSFIKLLDNFINLHGYEIDRRILYICQDATSTDDIRTILKAIGRPDLYKYVTQIYHIIYNIHDNNNVHYLKCSERQKLIDDFDEYEIMQVKYNIRVPSLRMILKYLFQKNGHDHLASLMPVFSPNMSSINLHLELLNEMDS